YSFRVDGVGDYLRVGAGQFGTCEVVGVEFLRPVGVGDEGPRQRRADNRTGVGRVAVDVQYVEVVREHCEREPKVAAVAQRRRIPGVDVGTGADPRCRRQWEALI